MEEIDLKELIEMFLEKKFLIIFVVVLFAILGCVYTQKFITPLYQSSTSLVLVQTGTDSATAEISDSITAMDLTLNSKLVDAYTEIAKSKVVAGKVVENLKLNTKIEELQKITTVTSGSDSGIIKITVKHTDPKQACVIANELAEVFIGKVNEIYKVQNLYVLDVAEVNGEPYNINLLKNVVIFAFVGAILVAGYVLLINMLDTTVKTDADIEKALGVPVLASIVLTDDSNKKKAKQGAKRKKEKTEIEFSDTVQFFYDDEQENEENEEDITISYEADYTSSKSPSRHQRSHKKGGIE